jgi:predicted nucleotidyltransferase
MRKIGRTGMSQGKTSWGIFEVYRKAYEEAYAKALDGVKYLHEQGAKKVYLFGSIAKPDYFMRESDIDIAVEGMPEEKRLTVEAMLIDILHPYDFDLLLIDSKDIIVREEIREAVKREGICIEKF